MPDEDLEVVFAYESNQEPDFDAVRDDLRHGGESRNLVENGDIVGDLHLVPADDGYRGSPDLPRLQFGVQEVRFTDDPSYERSASERLDAFLDIVRDIYLAGEHRPAFVFGVQHHMGEAISQIGEPPVDAESLADDRINYVVWLDVFPPALVERYGRETLLSAPAWRTEEWDDGSVLVVAYEDPLSLRGFRDLNDHLGLADPGL